MHSKIAYYTSGIEYTLDVSSQQAILSRLLPIVNAGSLPNYPRRLALGGFEQYQTSHSSEIEGAIHFIQQELQPVLGDILKKICPTLFNYASCLGRDQVPFIRISGLPCEKYLPPTPFRGQRSMHEIVVSDQAYLLDLILLGLLYASSNVSGFVQSNIDPVDENNKSQPLMLHIDRGAYVTAIGVLRGGERKFTHMVCLSSLVEKIADSAIVSELNRQKYITKNAEKNSRPFNVLSQSIGGAYLISESIVAQGIEIKDIVALPNEAEAQSALSALLCVLDKENMFLEANSNEHCGSSLGTGHWRFALRSGDVLLLNNRRVLHGRSRSDGDPSGRNRWLRVAFGEKYSYCIKPGSSSIEIDQLTRQLYHWWSCLEK